jgi:hypothetical protein
VAGILLGIWGLGSAISGVFFGTRRLSMALNRQLSWLLAAVALSFTVYAAMPTVLALGVALFAGGAMIAPALIVATMLIGRITPASMHTEAYTWSTTTSITFGAAGGALAGVLVDHRWVAAGFLAAGIAVAVGALVAGWPRGGVARAEALATC